MKIIKQAITTPSLSRQGMINKLLCVLALTIAVSISLPSFAETAYVSTYEELKTAIGNTLVDNIVVTANINVPCSTSVTSTSNQDLTGASTAQLVISRSLTLQSQAGYKYTIKRIAANGATTDRLKSLISIRGNGKGTTGTANLTENTVEVTFTNIIIDGGAIWGNSTVSERRTAVTTAYGNAGRAMIDVFMGGTLNLEDGVVLQNGFTTYSINSVVNDSGSYNYGGAVRVEYHANYGGGTVNVKAGATIHDCSAQGSSDKAGFGGALGAYNFARLNVYGGTIYNCSAGNGGAIGCTWRSGSDHKTSGVIKLYGGSIHDCHANTGGAILTQGEVEDYLLGGMISNCSAKTEGGAIAIPEADTKVHIVSQSSEWLTISNCSPYVAGTTSTGNYPCISMHADATISTTAVYQVTFRNNNTDFAVLHVLQGNSLGEAFPAAPVNANFHFVGWYNGNIQITSSTEISGDITVTAQWDFQGSGTEDDPYLIPSETVWNFLAENVNAGTNYSDKYFRLTNDISVTTMVGGEAGHEFCGTFDGDGHKLTVSISDNTTHFVAPFHRVSGGSIKNLYVDGTVSSNQYHMSGLIGRAIGTVNISNCVVAINIRMSSDYAGGFVGNGGSHQHNDESFVVMTNCLFKGTFTGAGGTKNKAAGFYGWGASTPAFINCLENGTYENISNEHVPYFYEGGDNLNPTPSSNSYYKHASMSASWATDASAMSNEELVSSLGSKWVIDPITNQPMLKLFTNNGELPSTFSVSTTKQVRFSQGNLQYQASTGTWRFATHQYDYVGDATNGNVYVGETKCNNVNTSSTYSGWIDLFGWGTSGNSASGTAYQPWSTSTTGTQYGPAISSGEWIAANSDWGVVNAAQLGSGWCVLTNAEWGYLFYTRTTTATINDTPNARYAQSRINTDGASVYGIILFPDDFDGSVSYSGVTWGTINAPSTWGNDATYTACTTAGWTALEDAGCVFLPATGYRDGLGMAYVGTNCHYWASTAKGTSNAYNLDIDFQTNVVNPQQNYSRHYGFCVRLVYETPFLGAGTENDPYRISSEADWNLLADKVSTGYTYSGEYFQLKEDISVTTMVGTGSGETPTYSFCGSFDGDGHVLTFNKEASENFVAPFRYINGATIKNLIVDGTNTSSARCNGGMVAIADGAVTISNCMVRTTIIDNVGNTQHGTGNSACGGVLALILSTGNVTFNSCIFSGRILGSANSFGGFVGWGNDTPTVAFNNCLFNPAQLKENATDTKTYYRGGDSYITLNNSYYLTAFGTTQGKQAYSITANDDDVTISNLGNGTEYNVSGITAYSQGIKFGETFYAGNGDEVNLTLSHADAAEGYDFGGYEASSGTLVGSDNPYTLTMASDDVTISATWKKILTNANITIESVAYDGDSHTAVVKCGETNLIKGTDYTVDGTDALTNVGSTTFTITGTGGYTGDVTDLTFTIYRNFAFTNSDWMTWYGAEDLTVTPSEMETYVVTDVSETAITIESTEGKIYLNTPMLLKWKNSSTAEVHGNAPATALSLPTGLEPSPAYIGGVSSFANYLTGTVYVLAGSEFVRARVTGETTFDKSKCFIYLTSSNANNSRLYIIGDGPTGINPVVTDGGNDTWYTIGGRKLSKQPKQPGVYISKGKKVIVK